MELIDLYDNHKDKIMCKFRHYLKYYEQHFRKFKGQEITLVEVGVAKGGSLQLWDKYFNEDACYARIIGIDSMDKSHLSYDGNIILVEGDQRSEEFWYDFLDKYGPIDIFIDDGSHEPKDQIDTFKCVFDYMTEDSVYIVEDIQYSYAEKHGGGYRNPSSFIEFAKGLIDDINANFGHDVEPFVRTMVTRRMLSVSFICNLVIMEFGNATTIQSPVPVGEGV